MPARNLEAEKHAIGVFKQKNSGSIPESPQDWASVHRIAYPTINDLPDELKKTTAYSYYEGTGDKLDTLGAGVEKAGGRVEELGQGNDALRVLQNAIREKTGAAKTPLGESEIFKQAGVEGMGSLSQSLATRAAEIDMNRVDFQNIVSQMRGQYKDMADMALFNYNSKVDEYNKERDRLDKLDQDLKDHEQAIQLINLQHNLNKELKKIPTTSDLFKAEEEGLDWDGDKWVRDISGASASEIAETIKQIESGGNYEAQGGSGEFGAYQFMPGTWLEWSRQYNKDTNGIISGLEMTPENQDKVASWKIQNLLNEGYSPEQVASTWNSGSPDWEGKVGVNEAGVKYDVPGYVEKFKNALSAKVQVGDLGALDKLKARNLSVEIFGKRAGTKEENVGLIEDLMKEYTPDEISDLLKYSSQSVLFEGSIRDASESISFGFTAEKAERFMDSVDRSLEDGDMDRVKSILQRGAIESFTTDEQKLIRGDMLALELVNDISADLKEYEDKGGDTGIFAGKTEELVNKIGRVNDPELAKIANKIRIAIQKYRRSISGAAFTESEAAEYEAVFPNTKKVKELNSAKISSLSEVINGEVEFYMKQSFGSDAYDEIFGSEDISKLEEQLEDGEIIVKKNDTGEIGAIQADEFDAKLYTIIK